MTFESRENSLLGCVGLLPDFIDCVFHRPFYVEFHVCSVACLWSNATDSLELSLALSLYWPLISFLAMKVHLAMESGYLEKVDELCERHSLSGFVGETGVRINFSPFSNFLYNN